jgi:hypothetical protein
MSTSAETVVEEEEAWSDHEQRTPSSEPVKSWPDCPSETRPDRFLASSAE